MKPAKKLVGAARDGRKPGSAGSQETGKHQLLAARGGEGGAQTNGSDSMQSRDLSGDFLWRKGKPV